MRCESIQKSLMSYHDGELSDRLKLKVEAHLARCPSCSLILAELEHADGQAAIDMPDSSYFEDLSRKVMDSVREEASAKETTSKDRWGWGPYIPRFAPVMSLALVIVVAIGILNRIDEPVPQKAVMPADTGVAEKNMGKKDILAMDRMDQKIAGEIVSQGPSSGSYNEPEKSLMKEYRVNDVDQVSGFGEEADTLFEKGKTEGNRTLDRKLQADEAKQIYPAPVVASAPAAPALKTDLESARSEYRPRKYKIIGGRGKEIETREEVGLDDRDGFSDAVGDMDTERYRKPEEEIHSYESSAQEIPSEVRAREGGHLSQRKKSAVVSGYLMESGAGGLTDEAYLPDEVNSVLVEYFNSGSFVVLYNDDINKDGIVEIVAVQPIESERSLRFSYDPVTQSGLGAAQTFEKGIVVQYISGTVQEQLRFGGGEVIDRAGNIQPATEVSLGYTLRQNLAGKGTGLILNTIPSTGIASSDQHIEWVSDEKAYVLKSLKSDAQ